MRSLAEPALSEVEGLGISPAGSRSALARKAVQSRTGPGENLFPGTLRSLETDCIPLCSKRGARAKRFAWNAFRGQAFWIAGGEEVEFVTVARVSEIPDGEGRAFD